MKLRRYLESNGIPTTKFGHRIGVAPSYISLLMSGARQPSLLVVQRIKAATEGAVTADDFLDPAEAMKELI